MRVFNRILQVSSLFAISIASTTALRLPFPASHAQPQQPLSPSQADPLHDGVKPAAGATVADGTGLGVGGANRNVSIYLFTELEELSRIVDIAYCVGVTGIYAPFECAGRCREFPEFQLVDTWNTGPLMSDSCGYIALDKSKQRILVAFRGTYSIANTIVDLSTIPQEYVPYPGDPDEPEDGQDDSHTSHRFLDLLPRPWRWFGRRRGKGAASVMKKGDGKEPKGPRCNNCTVHMGFFSSWQNTRPLVLPHVERLIKENPGYKLHLVGHSLGGAVAALAGLEFQTKGMNPTVTTFGEPRIGNKGLRIYLDDLFNLNSSDSSNKTLGNPDRERYRRMTHVDDPVPLLPLTEWGFLMHAGEIFISKAALSPAAQDLHHCSGDEDPTCIASGEVTDDPTSLTLSSAVDEESGEFDATFWDLSNADQNAVFDFLNSQQLAQRPSTAQSSNKGDEERENQAGDENFKAQWGIPARFKMWQLFFAHRDYFWRLGLCLPGGDPYDWGRGKHGDGVGNGDGEDGDEGDHGGIEELRL